jgi:glucosylglycerate synthase
LDSNMWENPDVSRFGIDIFETYTALAKDYKIKQARLGIKSHDTKDPASQLASMFKQVVYTMFICIEHYDSYWKEINEVTKVEMVGEAEYEDAPEPIEISLSATMDTYKNNYDKYLPVYESVLDQEIQHKFEQLKLLESSNVDLSSEVWAKTVYSFIAAFHKSPLYSRDKLIDALRTLWIGRIAHFLKETWEQRRDEAEKRVIEEAVVFENLKPYLIEKYF